MALSVVRKLERCERVGRARQGDDYQLIQYKIKIKDCFSTRQVNKLRAAGSLNYVAPSHEDIKPENLPACRLQNLHAQAAACKESSPLTPSKLQQIHLHAHENSNAPCSPSSPCKLQAITLQDGSQQNLNEHDELQIQLLRLQNHEEDVSWLRAPMELLYETVLQERIYSKTSSEAMLIRHPFTSRVQANDEASRASSPWRLQETTNEQEKEINWTPSWSSPELQRSFERREEDSCSPRKLKRDKEEETERLGSGEDETGRARSSWKLQKERQEMAGGRVWERVKTMECECCGMEEEFTRGYEERVRAGLRGHWLCGLCQEAVEEERKRVGGSVQAALAAHMQPCRRFSSRARSKDLPAPSDVAVPRAVCRLLCRHLSTPASARHHSSVSVISRSSSCLPSLPTPP